MVGMTELSDEEVKLIVEAIPSNPNPTATITRSHTPRCTRYKRTRS